MNIKLRIWQAILPLLLASSTTAERAPTCTTHEVNLLQNPSFESGSLAGWSLVEDNMVVFSDPHAADGHYYLKRALHSNGDISGVYQPITGLVEGSTYTVSAQWRIQKPIPGRRVSCDLAFYMVGDTSTSYVGGYENLRATPENTAWSTVSAQFTADGSSGTFFIYLHCPKVRHHQARAALDDIKILSGETTTSCASSSTSSTATPVASISVPSSVNPLPSSTIIPPHLSTTKPSSSPAATSVVSSGPSSSSIPSSIIPPVSPSQITSPSTGSPSEVTSSSSLTRVTFSSRPHPSSRPTVRPIEPSSGPVVSSVPASTEAPPSVTSTLPSETGPAISPSAEPTPAPSSGSGNGSGNDSGNGSGNGSGNQGSPSAGETTASPTAPPLTTSTIFTTRTSTITACASTVTDCPARSTYVTTETIVVSTTICPVEATTTNAGPIITGSPAAPSDANGHHYTTETILSTRTITVTGCPSTVKNCPARDKTTSVTTETLVAGTTVYEVAPTATGPVQTGAPNGKPAPGQDSNGNVPGPAVTGVATANPSQPPVDVVYVTSTRVSTVLACPPKKEALAM